MKVGAATVWRSAALRAIGLFALWVVLSGGGATDLAPGLAAAGVAAWISLRLLPPGTRRVAPLALCAWGLRFLGQSLLAGIDVARRALSPALPLDPGFVTYVPGLAPGPTRHLLATVASLLPGTFPAGEDAGGSLTIHCLDRGQPVAAQLAAEEALLLRAIGRKPGNG